MAVILVHEPKKNFFKKFLYDPFPVESQLAGKLQNHLNAEIAGAAIGSRLFHTIIFFHVHDRPHAVH